jgi:Xaa-Pro aminopeptidase
MGDEGPFAQRMGRLRAAMVERGIEVALFSVGPELPWLCGYEAMPLERLTMLVVCVDEPARLVVPELEAPRVVPRGDLFTIEPWSETDDPISMVADRLGGVTKVVVGDRTWARFVLDLQRASNATFARAAPIVDPLRRVKDAHEIEALAAAADAADRVARRLQSGEIALMGRTEASVSDEIGRRLVAEGHARVNFAIVAAGPNAASPHHEAGERVIGEDEVVLCDFGGTMLDAFGVGYCSDITRCVVVGAPPADLVRAYEVLEAAQAAAVSAATVGTAASAVDAAARQVLADGGVAERCIHRVGHGIGVEAHEEPYLVAGNDVPLSAGEVFSIEPGIYLPGEWGLRLEDIVVATDDGPRPLNHADHHLAVIAP